MLAREKHILATRALDVSLNVLYWRCRQFDTGRSSRLADGLRHPSSAFVCNSSKEESGSSSSGTDAASPHAAVESPTLSSTGTNGLGYTVSSLYIKVRRWCYFDTLWDMALQWWNHGTYSPNIKATLPQKRDLPQFVELDHLARRRKRDTEDIIKVSQRSSLIHHRIDDPCVLVPVLNPRK